MESKDLKKLQLMEAIAEGKPTSQRELSDKLQISLGLVNTFIKRLVKKGYLKVTTIPKSRVQYLLTPAGALEKTRLTYEYISSSYRYFKTARTRLDDLFDSFEKQGKTRMLFYGIGDIADIAYLSLTGTTLRLLDVVEPRREGDRFHDKIIKGLSRLETSDFDVLLITTVENHATILESFVNTGISEDQILFIR